MVCVVVVRYLYARGTPEVRSRCGRGTLEVHVRGTLEQGSWFPRDALWSHVLRKGLHPRLGLERAEKLPRMARLLQPTEPHTPAAQRASLELVFRLQCSAMAHALLPCGSLMVRSWLLMVRSRFAPSSLAVRSRYARSTVGVRFLWKPTFEQRLIFGALEGFLRLAFTSGVPTIVLWGRRNLLFGATGSRLQSSTFEFDACFYLMPTHDEVLVAESQSMYF